jgi:hypothetical protein
MKSVESFVEQMNQVLEELVQVATQLRQVSLQVIAEDELAPLQHRQEELLVELEKTDHHLQRYYTHQIDAKTQEHFHQQLQKFQQLNEEFLHNLATSHGLIQFELRRLQEGDLPDWSHLNKMSSASDTPQTPDAEEEKKDS